MSLSSVRATFRQNLVKAVAFCAVQVLVLLWIAPSSGGVLGDRYLKLLNWDSVHYQNILDKGYYVPSDQLEGHHVHGYQTDVGFFPGYPGSARLVKIVSGLSSEYSLLLAAQFACVGFWFFVFLILTHWGVRARVQNGFALLILIHPAAFFLVSGYTEPLFLMSLLAMIYFTLRWQDKNSPLGFLLAALSGIIASATRIVGFAVASFAVVDAFYRKRKLTSALLLSFLSSLGTPLFFAYCQYRFGAWNIYLKAQSLGWGNNPDYWAVINPRSYIPHFFFEDTVTSVSRAAIPFTAAIFWLALKYDSRRSERAGIYLVAFLISYISLSGKANANMDSMIRYTFPSFVLLLLVIARNFEFEDSFQRLCAGFKAGLRAWVFRIIFLISLAT